MKRCKRRYNSKKGVTLVDLVVAIAIVSIVFASTMTAIVHGYISIVENKSLEDASAQAQGVADTVSTALEKAFSSNNYTGDPTDQTAKKTFYNNLVLETIDGDGTYDGLSTKLNNVEFIDQISNPSVDFPDSSSISDMQCTVQYLTNSLPTSASDGSHKEFDGYKVMVNAKSSQGDIIASSIVTIK